MQPKVVELANGRWRGILPGLGIESRYLSGKQGPCPKCGGKDRFRFDDKEGRGTWICNQCGAGDGFNLLELVNGWGFAEAARRVEEIAGDYQPQKPRPELTDGQRLQILRQAWQDSKRVEAGDLVAIYLRSRGIELSRYPAGLRFAPAMRYDGVAKHPAMLATVSDSMGNPVTMHRTYLREDGLGKAAVPSPRKMMPGTLPDGAAIRLGEAGERLGIAEGIETALSASLLFNMPVWAAINTTMMKKWIPPEGTWAVTVFGDNDPKYGGHAAAWQLAHRLACEGCEVAVEIPDGVGQDWNDVLQSRKQAA